MSQAQPAAGRQNVRHGSLVSAVRAEALKSKHGAPLRLAIALSLPAPLLAAFIVARMPGLGVQYSPWNYWYVLLMPLAISLFTATVANGDARMGNRALLSDGTPLSRVWLAKSAWCLMLSLLANLIVFAGYGLLAAAVPQGAASMTSMFAAALALTVVSSWMIPATLFLTMRCGMLAGIFIPLALQMGLSFGWSAVPYWPACPPTATIVVPTAFLPVLPSGEPATSGMALVSAVSQAGPVSIALAVACALTCVLTIAGAAWLSRSEELR